MTSNHVVEDGETKNLIETLQSGWIFSPRELKILCDNIVSILGNIFVISYEDRVALIEATKKYPFTKKQRVLFKTPKEGEEWLDDSSLHSTHVLVNDVRDTQDLKHEDFWVNHLRRSDF